MITLIERGIKMSLEIKKGMGEVELMVLLDKFCKKNNYEDKCASELYAELSHINCVQYGWANEKLTKHCEWLDKFIYAWDVADVEEVK
jgi:hypothetical protein|tara:strand:+ start:10012 stop:10275 length:264 start_codon:yes stop_codon:yes gene_type:complete